MSALLGIATKKLFNMQFYAVARLQVFFTGYTHELMAGFVDEMRAIVTSMAGEEGKFDTVGGFRAQQKLFDAWGDTLTEWTKAFQKARMLAARFPFGGMCEFHSRLVAEAEEKSEAKLPKGFFDPQIQILMNAAAEYLYDDGLTISGRIWRIDRDARDGMSQSISVAISEGKSAWDLAKDLEQFLGADADCPRWTSTRLYQRTKKEIAGGDPTGLISGANCDGQGVAYNALRLARTEIQKAHALATDAVMKNSPWVEKEVINLSAQHPEPDICDDVVDGGEDGKGIYEVGEIELPLHPNCLCFKTAVLADSKAFTDRLAAWTKGGESWPEMDDYARYIDAGEMPGGLQNIDLSNDGSLFALGVWLFGKALEL